MTEMSERVDDIPLEDVSLRPEHHSTTSSLEQIDEINAKISLSGSNDQVAVSRNPKSHIFVDRPAWFTTVSINLGLTAAVLGVNIAIIAWIRSTFSNPSDGSAQIFFGNCSRAGTLSDIAHLVINVLSTLLLAASNYCAQLLLAPTRLEVEKAHQRGRWLQIGTLGHRNLPWIGAWRVCLAALLFLSSIPLHLL